MYLLTWSSNLTGRPVFLFAKSDNPKSEVLPLLLQIEVVL